MNIWVKRFLWTLTAMAAILMLILTVRLAGEAVGLNAPTIPARLTGSSMYVQIRDEPALSASISTLLERYTEVMIINAQHDGRTQWYQIAFDEGDGWVVSSNLIIQDPPVSDDVER
ncbi:MAG: SH3 domain-containing protein [Anaerolineales bacterium]|nr:SH3 domain-containing protein [Anaerolineales bacterium]